MTMLFNLLLVQYLCNFVQPNQPPTMWTSICLFNDSTIREKLRPITDHRNIWDLLIGTSTIKEKWQGHCQTELIFHHDTSAYPWPKADLYLLGSALPSALLIQELSELQAENGLFAQNQLIAFKSNAPKLDTQKLSRREINSEKTYLTELEESIQWNSFFLRNEIQEMNLPQRDFSQSGTQILHPENCRIESNTEIKGSILDASSGPIYIGKNVQINIGTLIQGPACLLEGVSTNIGAKIRPNCTIGQGCKIGGEINQSIFYPFSNKSHDGSIGSSIIGSFSNLGALSSCSNLKNDLKSVEIFDYTTKKFRITSEKNLGVFIGDYVTTGIMTKFNTGSSIGSHCNLSSKGFLPKHVPSFTWGEFPQLTIYRFDKALKVAKDWINLKGQHIPENLSQRMEEIWKEMSTFRT